jgi:hypothetical protein
MPTFRVDGCARQGISPQVSPFEIAISGRKPVTQRLSSLAPRLYLIFATMLLASGTSLASDAPKERKPEFPNVDAELLTSVFRQAIPTANVFPFVKGKDIILRGDVRSQEDVDTINGILRAVCGVEFRGSIVNELVVGPPQLVQLDCAMFRVNRAGLSQGDGTLYRKYIDLLSRSANRASRLDAVNRLECLAFFRHLCDIGQAKHLPDCGLVTYSCRTAEWFPDGAEQIVTSEVPRNGPFSVQVHTYPHGSAFQFKLIVKLDRKIELEVEYEFRTYDKDHPYECSLGTDPRIREPNTSVTLDNGETLLLIVPEAYHEERADLAFWKCWIATETPEDAVLLVTPHLVKVGANPD